MKLLIANNVLCSLKSRELVPLECENCANVFYKTKNIVLTSIKGHPDFALRFCSLKCHYDNQLKTNWIYLECAECASKVLKQKSKIKQNKNNFCSKSCSAKYQNKNKTLGKIKKSKSEVYLSNLIRADFQQLNVEENIRSILPSKLELDIYIASIGLAIEINGPLHYFPIFGKAKLKKIKINDANKKIEAHSINCNLIIVNISKIKYWEETKRFLDFIYKYKIKPKIEKLIRVIIQQSTTVNYSRKNKMVSGRQGFEPR